MGAKFVNILNDVNADETSIEKAGDALIKACNKLAEKDDSKWSSLQRFVEKVKELACADKNNPKLQELINSPEFNYIALLSDLHKTYVHRPMLTKKQVIERKEALEHKQALRLRLAVVLERPKIEDDSIGSYKENEPENLPEEPSQSSEEEEGVVVEPDLPEQEVVAEIQPEVVEAAGKENVSENLKKDELLQSPKEEAQQGQAKSPKSFWMRKEAEALQAKEKDKKQSEIDAKAKEKAKSTLKYSK